jgi:hypothetical protein
VAAVGDRALVAVAGVGIGDHRQRRRRRHAAQVGRRRRPISPTSGLPWAKAGSCRGRAPSPRSARRAARTSCAPSRRCRPSRRSRIGPVQPSVTAIGLARLTAGLSGSATQNSRRRSFGRRYLPRGPPTRLSAGSRWCCCSSPDRRRRLPFVTAPAPGLRVYANSRYRGNDGDQRRSCSTSPRRCAAQAARTKVVSPAGQRQVARSYQSQAVGRWCPRPGRRRADLTAADLPAADAMLLLAAHPSAARCCATASPGGAQSDFFDHPVARPLAQPPQQPPYSAEFLARYRAPRRPVAISFTTSAAASTCCAGAAARDEQGFVVPGTADPRSDPSVDPNDRRRGRRSSATLDRQQRADRPRAILGARSWLSQWSIDDANSDGVRRPRHGPGTRRPRQRRQHLHARLRGRCTTVRPRTSPRHDRRRDHAYIGRDGFPPAHRSRRVRPVAPPLATSSAGIR